MAAKKKSDASGSERKKPTTRKKATPKKSAKEELPEDSIQADDDFGLDDIELDPVVDIEPVKEEKKTKAKAKPRAKKKAPVKQKASKELAEEVVEESVEEVAQPDAPTPDPVPTPESEVETVGSATFKSIASEDNNAEQIPEPKETEVGQPAEKSNSGLWIVGIAVVIIAVLIYFLVLKPDAEPEPEPVKVEQPTPEPEPQPEPEPEPEPEPVISAELFTISAADSRFYVVVGSFYDEDLAYDQANKIVAEGKNAYVLQPTDDFKFYRVSVNAADTRAEAENDIESLRSTFGENIWVLKY